MSFAHSITNREILQYLDQQGVSYRFMGDPNDTVSQISSLQSVADHSICWVKNQSCLTEEAAEQLRNCCSVLVVAPFPIESASTILVSQPKQVFFPIINHFFASHTPHSISERAVVLTERIGKNVHIGPGCYIGADVAIGDNTVLHPNVVIECPCIIGADCEIFAGVVIGGDGFGYYMDGEIPRREPHYRGVVLGDGVEVGANSCIDRGLLTDTVIGDHVKIDNLCHIGHNVVIEANCLIVAGSVICGSAHIGKNAYLAPGCVVRNQISIGESTFVGLGAVVVKDVDTGKTVVGVPAKLFTQR